MDLIIGGRKQGKLEFAKEKYNFKDSDVFFGESSDLSLLEDKKVIYNLHDLVARLLKENINIYEVLEKINPDVIICDEVGSGVVPIDKVERMWREETGRCCCKIAKESEHVTRVFCGIATVIK